ncbi:DUF59 domain-containing protein [Oenococcus sp. UCMA 17063]|nr:DUF59 domain-containing protein [Oenococcus sp. UCMA 17063]
MNKNTQVENVEKSLTETEFSAVIEALKQAIDPEMGVSVQDLGLIYSLQVVEKDKKRQLRVLMALTILGCPLTAELQTIIEDAIMTYSDFTNVLVQIDPTIVWDPNRISRIARISLGIS